jgi:surface polysaccharide O-acyltransferase-like enzyme
MNIGDKRELSIDLLRILACLLIILRHITDIYAISHYKFRTGVFFDAFSYPSLAIFIMITGYFVFNKNESYKNFFKKRFSRILIPFVFWSLIFFQFNHRLDKYSFNFQRFIYEFLTKGTYFHLWYVYFIIGIYLITPLIRKMALNIDLKDITYVLVLSILFSSVLPKMFNGFGMYFLFLFHNWWIYIFMGLLLSRLNKNKLLLYFSLLLISIYVAVLVISMVKGAVAFHFTDPFSLPMIGVSFGVFYLFKYVNINNIITGNLAKILITLSNFTYSVYLVHALFISLFVSIIKINPFFINPMLGVPIFTLAVFGLSYILTISISKIPILKKAVI